MQDPGKQVLLNLRAVGNAAKTCADMRATRCFVVPADDNHVQWIWAAESRPVSFECWAGYYVVVGFWHNLASQQRRTRCRRARRPNSY